MTCICFDMSVYSTPLHPALGKTAVLASADLVLSSDGTVKPLLSPLICGTEVWPQAVYEVLPK